jgi:propionyl-CoA carboxylase beta chain
MFVEHRSHEFGMEAQRIPGDGVVTGWGTINGRLVYVFSKDFTVFGGSLSGAHAAKIVKIQTMALTRSARRSSACSTPAARASRKASRPGRLCRHLPAEHAGLGRHPADQRHHGPLRGRRRLFPAMTDFIFMVKDTSYMYVTGPDVVKTVTNEVVTARGTRRRARARPASPASPTAPSRTIWRP